MKPLTKEDFHLLKGYFDRQPYRISSYSLPSIIAWSNVCYQSYYAITDGMVMVASEARKHPEQRYLVMPIVPDGSPAPALLREILRDTGYREICFVPGDYVERIVRASLETFFDIAEQAEYEDYIYRTIDLAELRGNRYSKKRNLIHQFSREYEKKNRVATGRITASVVPECLDFHEKWCAQRHCEVGQEENVACEKAAVVQSLLSIEALGWRGLWIRVDGEMSAFAIMSHLTPEMGVLNFEKAYPHIKGLYQFLDKECARQLFQGYAYINKESAMGLPALADSKKSYHPLEMLKSYSLKIRD